MSKNTTHPCARTTIPIAMFPGVLQLIFAVGLSVCRRLPWRRLSLREWPFRHGSCTLVRKNIEFNQAWIASFLALLLLAGCGGSGSSGSGGTSGGSNTGTSTSTNLQPNTAQGAFTGTSSVGDTFYVLVLPNDKFYLIYGTVSGSSLLAKGMITGQGQSSNGTYTAASASDFPYQGVPFSGKFTASYTAGSNLNGTLTEGGSTVTFNGTALRTSDYSYNIPASIPSVSGPWPGKLLDGSDSTLTINPDGTVSGSGAGCSFSGTAVPDGSKNFYNVSLNFGASPCLLPNQTATGVGFQYLLSDGVTFRLLVGVNQGTTGGVSVYGARIVDSSGQPAPPADY